MQNIVERYLRAFERLGLPWLLSAQLVVGIPYLVWRALICPLIGSEFLPLSSIFIIRDLLAIALLGPLYLYFMDEIRATPKEMKAHMDEDWLQQELFEKFFSSKASVASGIFWATFYISVTSWYLYWGFYNIEFYLERLISAYGLFFLGVVLYQGLVLFNVLVRKARDVELNLSALIDGLRPITRLALYGSVGWLAALSMITLPVFVLGFNDYGAIWYVGFYGLHYVSGLVIFLGLSFGFHEAMVRSKRASVLNLGKTLNEMYPEYEKQIMATGTSDKDIDSLITVYSSISGGKEWPFEWQSVLDLLLFNLLPIALSILGFNI